MPSSIPDGESFTIKSGKCILVLSYSLHRDSKYFPEPEKFNSDRFLNNDIDNSVYMPFGIGSRICINNKFAVMEMKIIVFHLLSCCELERNVKIKVPLEKKSYHNNG